MWLTAAAYTILLSYLTLAPDPWWFMGQSGRATEQAIDSTFADYLQHSAAYAVLGFLLVGAALAKRRALVLPLVVIAVLHGVVTESLQYFIPLRTCDWTDMLANVLGATAGCLLAGGVFAVARGRRFRRESSV